jgi:ABC-type lipoprotein release transport system permease subunit
MNLKTMIKFSFRNLMRHKIRTIFTILALCIGVAMTILVFSILRGAFESAFDLTIANDTGHIQIRKAAYEEEQLRLPVSSEFSVQEVEQLKKHLHGISNIKAMGAYINFSGTILATDHSVPVFIRGTDVFQAPYLDTMVNNIIDGSFFPPYNGIAFGNSAFYEALNIAPEDINVVMDYYSFAGNPKTFDLRIIPDTTKDGSSPTLRIPTGLVRSFPKAMVSKSIWEGNVPQFKLTVRYQDISVPTVFETYALKSTQDKEYIALADMTNLENPLASVILGNRLAEALEVGVNDIIRIRATDSNGMIAADAYTVIGIFRTGLQVVDSSTVLMPIPEIRRFLEMEDKATFFKIMLNSRDHVNQMVAQVRERLKNNGYTVAPPLDTLVELKTEENNPFDKLSQNTLSVEPWSYYAQALVQTNEAKWATNRFIIGLIVALVIFGVMNTMSLSIRGRSREIATLRAMGMEQKEIVRMVFIEGFMLSALGVIIGLIIAAILAYFLNTVGIVYPEDMIAQMNAYFEPVVRGKTITTDFITAAGIGIVAGVMGSIFPSRFAKNLKILNALQDKPDQA